ncbi:MAG: threonine--tRNA ligase [Treponemataceae bacterium]|nr:MAG: threonine--tRNA ligase [Treponemataceae bacterium]
MNLELLYRTDAALTNSRFSCKIFGMSAGADIDKIRHSSAHVMAQAVFSLFPGAKAAIGPAIDTGFYYDFDLPRKISPEDFPAIEKEMRRIISGNHDFVRKVVSKDEALTLFADQSYKIELIQALSESEEISVYTQDAFTDLCRGPHVANTKEINAQGFKLMRIAGAYWRGDEKRPMLTRIYAASFKNQNDLSEYLKMLEEAEKRDHRKIAKELDLFHIDEDNPGQIFWHPNGWTIYRTLENYVREKISAAGYSEVKTPFIMAQGLWEKSGHWAKYKDNMFVTESEKKLFAIKPMNCPGHIEIFKQRLRSYRDLPLRLAEFGSCTRNEPSGSLHGCMRIRGFVQDDAHIFCTEAQIESEVVAFTALLKDMYKDFGFTDARIQVKFSTRPELRVGDDATWDKAEEALASACKTANLPYVIAAGEGAFYGPKLEFTLIDALKREWQCGTIQLDYQMPSKERLNAEYVGEDNAKHTPVMLHRAVLGSLERFIGILLENYAGALPPWLSHIQVAVVPVAPAFNEYAEQVNAALVAAGLRSYPDLSNERLNAKIRAAQTQKIPYMLVVGEKEAAANAVCVRYRDGQEQKTYDLGGFIAYATEKIKNRTAAL